jgi:hypothetical protein
VGTGPRAIGTATRSGGQTAARNPGRPSDYFPEYVDQAAMLCRLGATDANIADFFEKEWRARRDSNA